MDHFNIPKEVRSHHQLTRNGSEHWKSVWVHEFSHTGKLWHIQGLKIMKYQYTMGTLYIVLPPFSIRRGVIFQDIYWMSKAR